MAFRKDFNLKLIFWNQALVPKLKIIKLIYVKINLREINALSQIKDEVKNLARFCRKEKPEEQLCKKPYSMKYQSFMKVFIKVLNFIKKTAFL